MTKVAVIGAGLIGRAWSIVFARAGFEVTLWDKFPETIPPALDYIAERLPELREAGLLADEPATVLARIHPAATIAEAVRWVSLVVSEKGFSSVGARVITSSIDSRSRSSIGVKAVIAANNAGRLLRFKSCLARVE